MDPATSATFEFTQQDYTRIILQDSLFNNATAQSNSGLTTKSLQKLEERETRLFLHAVTLSDYMRAKRIPRGLRINKGPIMGKDNSNFCDQWTAILNKCSFDLMALTIQEVTANLATVRDEISELKTKLGTEVNDPVILKQKLEECEQHKQELTKEITVSKRRKFERDTLDYERGRVYQWRNPTPKTRSVQQPPARRHRNTRASQQVMTTTDEYESESSNFSQTSGPFLGGRTNQGQRRLPPRGKQQRNRADGR